MWQLARFILATNRYADTLKLSADRLRHAYATSAAAAQREVVDPWLNGFKYTTPVEFDPRDNPPTAQSWLRRFGANGTALDKAFRTKQVRIFDGARFKRIKNRTRALQAGDVLLVPNQVSSLMRLLPHPPPAAAAALAAVRRAQAEQKDRQHGDDDTVWADEAAGTAPQQVRAVQPAAAAGQRVIGAAGRKLQAAAAVEDEESEWLPGPGSVSPRAAKTARGAAAAAAAAARAAPVPAASTPEWAGGRAVTAPADNRDAALRQQREQDAAQQQRERAAEPLERAVKRWVIARESDYLVLNKPPGVHVTGAGSADISSSSSARGSSGSTSTAGASSIEQVLDSSLSLGEQDQPTLVHDLAPAASGCLLVARSPQAAEWLQAAFERGHAYIDPTSGDLVADPEGGKASEDGTSAKGRQKRKVAAAKEARGRRSLLPLRVSVGRTYLAVVQGNMQGHRRGVINKQVMEGGQLRGAKTVFKVKHSGDGLTLLELTPLTAVREQLQVHCARELGHPVLGDYRRGFDPAALLLDREQGGVLEDAWPVAQLLKRLYGSSRAGSGRSQQAQPLLLHLHSIAVRKGRKQTVVSRARMSEHMRELCKAMHWVK